MLDKLKNIIPMKDPAPDIGVDVHQGEDSPSNFGLPLPEGAEPMSAQEISSAEGARPAPSVQAWRYQLDGSRAEAVARFYVSHLRERAWNITDVETFPNGYGHRLVAVNGETKSKVRINIAKWPHEPFTSLSIYLQG
jgi:hypothetical protein